jgi:hypothetical protein
LGENARSRRAKDSAKETTVSEDEGRVAGKLDQHAEEQDEVQAHKRAAQDEQGDEAAGEDEVEAHSHIRKATPKLD